MSYIDDKLEIIEQDKTKSNSDKPRQYLYRHMHSKHGVPQFRVIESDQKDIPTKVEVRNRMDGTVATWNRVTKVKDDYLFEKE